MSQIHAWKSDFEPDRVTAYAKGATKLVGRALIADGAAFRSKRRWYDLSFRCELNPDQAAVVAFAFRVGEPVPKSQWAKLGLPRTLLRPAHAPSRSIRCGISGSSAGGMASSRSLAGRTHFSACASREATCPSQRRQI